MLDDELREDHEDVGAGDDQLEEFTRELREEEKAKKKKLVAVAAVVTFAVAGGLYFSGVIGENPAPKAKNNTAMSDAAKTEKASEISGKMAATEGKNLIDEDMGAPGAVKESEALESDKAQAKSEQAEAKDVKSAAGSKNKGDKAKSDDSAPDYSVQVIATSDVALALRTKESITAKKIGNPFVSIGSVKSGVYVVHAGEGDASAIAVLKSKLAQAGFESVEQPSAGGKTSIIAGIYTVKKDAEELSGRLQKAGFKSKIADRKESADLYIVRVGGYKSREEASKAGESLKSSGFPVLGVSQ